MIDNDFLLEVIFFHNSNLYNKNIFYMIYYEGYL